MKRWLIEIFRTFVLFLAVVCALQFGGHRTVAHAFVAILAAFNPSPLTWTSSFEADPLNTDSLSQTDDHIRQVKVESRDRAETEHEWGSGMGNVTTDTGRHLEGSARCFVQTAAPTLNGTITASCLAEADRSGNRGCDEGRCWVDTDGADGILGGAGAADDYTYNIALDSDADGDADSWQPVKASVSGGVGGTVPTSGIILWTATSSCPAGYTEDTNFRNLMIRGADGAAANTDIPNTPGVTCTGSSAPAGCGAAGGAANYSDALSVGELANHTHSESATHTHTTPAHTHTGATTTLPDHQHEYGMGNNDFGGGVSQVADAANPSLGNAVTFLGGGGASMSVTIPSGGSGTSGPSSSTITATGGGENHLHPFRTVLFCTKS